ncbi:MAG: DMT family transporter [Proteobacteria bacterium]|nr:DMT family transporter [Pseudomonadota bacterium]
MTARERLAGSLCAALGVFGFSVKAIIIKLAYAWDPALDAVTLLALRMLYSAPFFIAMAWWSGRGAAPLTGGAWWRLVLLGFVGYYLASLLDFMGLAYISAGLERLTLFLYPTIVVLLSAWWLRTPITRRHVLALLLSYAGIVLAFWHDLAVSGDAHGLALGGSLVFASALLYAVYLVAAGPVIARIGATRFIAWAMLVSTVFVLVQFALTRPTSALAVPPSIHALSLLMAVASTVVPTWLIAVAIRRLGANQTSLVGSLGPVFTIVLGAMVLGEAVNALQLAGAALVLAGVMMVSMKPAPAKAAATDAGTNAASRRL